MDRLNWVLQYTVAPVLDVGCGHSGYFWNGGEHIENKVEYLGIDRYEEPVDTGFDVPDSFVVADARKLPVEDNAYRTVVLGDVIELIDDPIRAIEEARRVAEEILLVTAPDEDSWLPGVDLSDYIEPKRRYTEDNIIWECMEAGIDKENIQLEHTVDVPLAFWLVKIEL